MTTESELDSFMYQTVGHQIIEAYAECMSLPLFRGSINGTAVRQSINYSPTEKDEVENLCDILRQVKVQ
jgi:diphthine-ammonia ligase